jgi:hypothetical protein
MSVWRGPYPDLPTEAAPLRPRPGSESEKRSALVASKPCHVDREVDVSRIGDFEHHPVAVSAAARDRPEKVAVGVGDQRHTE